MNTQFLDETMISISKYFLFVSKLSSLLVNLNVLYIILMIPLAGCVRAFDAKLSYFIMYE